MVEIIRRCSSKYCNAHRAAALPSLRLSIIVIVLSGYYYREISSFQYHHQQPNIHSSRQRNNIRGHRNNNNIMIAMGASVDNGNGMIHNTETTPTTNAAATSSTASTSSSNSTPIIQTRITTQTQQTTIPPLPPPPAHLKDILLPGTVMQAHGTPVGAVVLPVASMGKFNNACKAAFPEANPYRNRGVEDYYDYDEEEEQDNHPIIMATMSEASPTATIIDDENNTTNDENCNNPNIRNRARYKAIHVPTEVAAALVDGEVPALVDFIRRQPGGRFLPGARMKKDPYAYASAPADPSSSDDDIAESKFTFAEIFAGVGGFRIGLEAVGGRCVLASEKDAVACAFYRRHFGIGTSASSSSSSDANNDDSNNNIGGNDGEHQQQQQQCDNSNTTNTNNNNANDHRLIEGDVLDLVPSDFPSSGFDLLTGGFPCQPFSVRGKKEGLSERGHRGQLYLEMVRILMDQRPNFFLFENVVGLVTMEGGRVYWDEATRERTYEAGGTMTTVVEAFEGCGYHVRWHVVNAKHFCPQHRERVYFFGSRSELDCPAPVWDNIYASSTRGTEDEEKPTVRDYLEKDHGSSREVADCELTERQWEMVRRKCDERTDGANDSDDDASGGGGALAERGLEIDLASAPTLISSYRTPASRSSKLVMEEADGTPRTGSPLRPRFLTPTEFRRMMGFPETFEVAAPMEVSTNGKGIGGEAVDGHIYKVLGNAVVPSVVEAIGREIVRIMEGLEENGGPN